jgi:hypothetical protein
MRACHIPWGKGRKVRRSSALSGQDYGPTFRRVMRNGSRETKGMAAYARHTRRLELYPTSKRPGCMMPDCCEHHIDWTCSIEAEMSSLSAPSLGVLRATATCARCDDNIGRIRRRKDAQPSLGDAPEAHSSRSDLPGRLKEIYVTRVTISC